MRDKNTTGYSKDDLLTHLEDVADQFEEGEHGPTRDDLLTHLEDVAAQFEEEE